MRDEGVLRREAGKKRRLLENKGEFFHEFVTVSEKCPCEALKALEEHGILGGYPLGNHRVLWCCTEMNTKEEMDEVVRILKEV